MFSRYSELERRFIECELPRHGVAWTLRTFNVRFRQGDQPLKATALRQHALRQGIRYPAMLRVNLDEANTVSLEVLARLVGVARDELHTALRSGAVAGKLWANEAGELLVNVDAGDRLVEHFRDATLPGELEGFVPHSELAKAFEVAPEQLDGPVLRPYLDRLRRVKTTFFTPGRYYYPADVLRESRAFREHRQMRQAA